MTPPIPSAEIRLSYPLYALDFDPEDPNRLIVGGGGGVAKSGVGNKISVLDTSHADALQVVSEINLSRDEDSVNCLVAGPRRNKDSILVYAGINSSEDDVKKGKNEHFRVFAADLPSKASAEPKISELSRSMLFSTKDADAYQRLLRISGRVGAVATGTIGRSKDSEIAVFDLPAPSSNNPAPKLRGKVELVKEAMDMDLLQISDDEHQLVYCDSYDIHTLVIGKESIDGPHCVYTIPFDVGAGATDRPSFRCIRFLSPTFVLAVANRPKAGGVVLYGFRLPKVADLGKDGKEGKCRLSLSTHLPKGIARGTGLAVRNLTPPAAPGAPQPDAQFVVAVIGQDSSITLYTLDHQSVGEVNLIANLYPVTTLKEVHLGPISGVAFSPFIPPASEEGQSTKPQHLKLASIGSMGNTCVVHRLPLKYLPPSISSTSSKGKTATAAGGRYILALKSRKPSPTTLLFGTAILIAIIGLLLQGFLEVKGISKPVIGARNLTPAKWHSPGIYYHSEGPGTAVVVTSTAPSSSSAAEGKVAVEDLDGVLAEYLATAAAVGEDGEKVKVVLRPVGGGEGGEDTEEEAVVIKVEVPSEEEQAAPAKGWEELSAKQRELWKKALKRAGKWTEEVGEAVFKGVLFGEIGGAVGGAVREMVR